MNEVDLVERMARASYEAEVNRWPQYARGFQKWEELGPETKDRFHFAARAAYAIARRAVLEEAAKVAEGQKRPGYTGIFRWQNVSEMDSKSWSVDSQYGAGRTAAADAIRKLEEE